MKSDTTTFMIGVRVVYLRNSLRIPHGYMFDRDQNRKGVARTT